MSVTLNIIVWRDRFLLFVSKIKVLNQILKNNASDIKIFEHKTKTFLDFVSLFPIYFLSLHHKLPFIN